MSVHYEVLVVGWQTCWP